MFLGEDDVSFFFDAIKKRLGATLDGCHTRERRSDGGSRREALGTTK